MKLTAIFLITAGMHVCALGFSQRVTIKENNISLEKLFEKIKQQTGLQFFYADQVLAGTKNVSVAAKKEPFDAVLKLALKDQGLEYTVSENTIIVRKMRVPELFAVTVAAIETADHEVKGRVTDESGLPMAGVSVTVKGSTNGAATDANGNFSITVPDNAVLVFSYVGYKSVEQPVKGKPIIDISLKPVPKSIDEIVVVGYGTQRKRDLTGTISSVKGEEVGKMAATNPVSTLQGKVPGLTVVNSGRAGASPTVRIRGVNSTNNSDPLFVVDGVFQTNIDYLNPADIEKIEVLRDPSSIAIFGLQGGNGVIVVTTKRPAKGDTRVSFQSFAGIQHVTDKIKVTDAAGFKKLYNAQLANLNAAAFDYTNYNANTNWQDLVLRDAVMNNNNITVSNSGEKSTTLLSLGYNIQDGVLKYDQYQKYIGRLNHEIRISKSVKVGGDITGFYWKQENPGADLTNALWAAPIVPVNANNNLYYSMPSFQRAQVSNPVARLNQNTDNAVLNGYRVIGSVFAEAKFLQNFTFRSSFYTDMGVSTSRSYSPLPFRYINLGEGAAKTDTSFDAAARTTVSQAQSDARKFQQDHTLTFDKRFNSHHITALAGFTTLFQSSAAISGSRRDTGLNVPDSPEFWYLNIVNANNPTTNGGSGGEESYMSYLARVNYAYGNKYLVNLTFRRDGSSKFSPANRWGNFGSIGLGWVISDENFFKFKKIDFLKLRGAWGTVGSGLGLPSNLYLPGLTTANTGVFGDNVYGSVSPSYVPDPNLHWEVVRGIDLGVDARAFNNRLNAEVTLYDRTTKDILTTITLPGTAGNYSYRTNLGSITNRGVELALGWSDKIGRNLTYSAGVNFSYNKNKVVSIGDNINFQILGNGGVNKTETGQSIGYFYGYRQVGVYQVVRDFDRMPGFSNSLPGDIAFADVNGDGVISDKDRTYLGTPFPLYNFGGNVSLGYKQFDLVIEGQGVAGNKVYVQRRTNTFAVLNFEANRLNAWTSAGTSNVEPIMDNTRANNFLFSSYFLEPGDYFRIRTLQLGYTFSKNALARTPVKQLRVYVSGQNIATFSKTTGYTPEAPLGSPIAGGADNGTYPVPAVYSLGVNITF
ncbi:MAG: TonB-dependent receptor [Ferruginibacter sp.]